MAAIWKTRNFLVVVKTYPNPSASLNETVCTAAIDGDGNWARLYPIPFRTLSEGRRFHKWQWIRAQVAKSPSDTRRESYKLDTSSIELLGKPMAAGKEGWLKRWSYVEHLVSPSVEAVRASGASLGLIKPTSFALTFEDDPEKTWTQEQFDKLTHGSTTDLFGNRLTPTTLLQKIPVKVRYKFSCEGSCEHELLFEDWEVCESWRTWQTRYPERSRLEKAIVNKYVDVPAQKDNLFLFIGNHFRFQDSFKVVGHAQPLHLAKCA